MSDSIRYRLMSFVGKIWDPAAYNFEVLNIKQHYQDKSSAGNGENFWICHLQSGREDLF